MTPSTAPAVVATEILYGKGWIRWTPHTTLSIVSALARPGRPAPPLAEMAEDKAVRISIEAGEERR